MKKFYLNLTTLLFAVFLAYCPLTAQEATLEDRVNALLEEMTLDEMIGQRHRHVREAAGADQGTDFRADQADFQVGFRWQAGASLQRRAKMLF